MALPPTKSGLEGPRALCRFVSPIRVSSSDWAHEKRTEFSVSPAKAPVSTSTTSSHQVCRGVSPVRASPFTISKVCRGISPVSTSPFTASKVCRGISPVSTSPFTASKADATCSRGTSPIFMVPKTRKVHEDFTMYLHGDPWQDAEDIAIEDLDTWFMGFYSLHATRDSVQEPLLSTMQEPVPFLNKNSLRGWGALKKTGWRESPDCPPDVFPSAKPLPEEMPMYSMSRHPKSHARGIVGMEAEVSAHSSWLRRFSRRGWDTPPSADNRLGIGGTEGVRSGLPSLGSMEVDSVERTSSSISCRSRISERTTASSCTHMSSVSTASSPVVLHGLGAK